MQQAQHARAFIFATAPGAHQFVEEQNAFRSELRKTLFQQLVFLMMIASGRMLGQAALLSRGAGRVQLMAGDLFHVRAVDDQFLLGDAYRQQFPDALPRHGVEVLQVGHMAFRVHRAVENPGGIVGLRRQSEQVRFLFLVQVDGPALGFPVDAHIGDIGQPVRRRSG